MKRRGIVVLLLLTFLCTCLASTASARISNIRVSDTEDGNVRIRWDDSSNSSSYDVKYRLDDWKPNYNYYQSCKNTNTVLIHLIPGQTYTITVEGGSSSASTTFTPSYGVFKEFTTKDYLRLTQDTFSIRELENSPSSTFDVRVYWPKLRYDRDYSTKLVLKTPLGYCGKVIAWDSFTFENKYAYRYMTYSMMSDWLKDVEDDYKEIPTGRYQFQFYVNGQIYSTANFTLYR